MPYQQFFQLFYQMVKNKSLQQLTELRIQTLIPPALKCWVLLHAGAQTSMLIENNNLWAFNQLLSCSMEPTRNTLHSSQSDISLKSSMESFIPFNTKLAMIRLSKLPSSSQLHTQQRMAPLKPNRFNKMLRSLNSLTRMV